MYFNAIWIKFATIWTWTISITRYSILVNGVPIGFFPSCRGLRQGDPLSPYLFVMGMEVLSILLRRAMVGGYISDCVIRGRGEVDLNIPHLFADNTIVFCEASKKLDVVPIENHRIFSRYSLVYLLPFVYIILLPFTLYFPSFYFLFCFLFVSFFCIYIGVSILCYTSIQ